MSALLLAALAGSDSYAATQRFALVVGANDGGIGRVTLRYAVTDAQAMEDVLLELGGVAPGASVLLEDPDRSAMDQGMAQVGDLVARAHDNGDRAEVIVYYSGHSDAQGLRLSENHYLYSELRESLDDLDAEVRILILDSCSSGAIVRTKGGTHTAPFLVDDSVKVEGYAYLTSASADEAAQEADSIQGSFFTQALVTGLRGAADNSADGRVTLNEVYQFSYDQTLSRTEGSMVGPQHASFDIQLVGSGDLVMTELSTAGAELVLGQALGGRIYVRDSKGALVVELDKPAGRPLSLGLTPGEYRVLWVDEKGDLARADLTLAAGVPGGLSPKDFQSVDGALAVRRGDEPLTPQKFTFSAVPLPYLTRNIYGVELALLGTRSGSVSRAQLATVAAGVTQSFSGVQAAGAFAWSEGDGQGLQTAGGAVYTRGMMTGVQLSPITIAGDIRGTQVGAVTIAGEMMGLQLGTLNIARASSQQLGVINIGGEVQRKQVGVVNIAGRANGGGLGIINIAGSGSGSQLGIINVAGRDYTGTSLGLLTLKAGGYNTLQVGGNELTAVELVGTLGDPKLHTVFAYSFSPNTRYLQAGLGLGSHKELSSRWFVDTDVVVTSGDYVGTSGVSLGLRPRVKAGFALTEHLAIAAGPSLNVGLVELGYGDQATAPPLPSAPGQETEGGFQTLWGTDIWPGASLSVNWM
jgi:hypothetical protein